MRPRPVHLVTTSLAVLVGAALTLPAASAHVDADPNQSSVQPNGEASVQFVFDHGCSGEPTTSLRVQIPDGVTDVVPQPVAGWQTAVTSTEFSWTGGAVPDTERAVFTAAMRVSGAAGTTIWFPTVQGCPTLEEAWIEIASPEQAEPAKPAPSIVLPVAIEAPAGASTSSSAAAPSTTRTTLVPGEAAVTEEGSPRDNTGLVVGLVAVGAVVVGAVMLFLRYKGHGNTTS